MKPILSTPTFIRKQLKMRGKTEHTGRGSYIMTCTNYDEEELKEKFLALKERLNQLGMLDEDDPRIEQPQLTIKAEFYDESRKHVWSNEETAVYYRTVVFWGNNFTALSVYM